MFHLARQKLTDENHYKIEKTRRKQIPEPLHFNRERNLPIATIFGKRGFFVFPSVQSYDMFKRTNFNLSVLDADGVGVPLFHIVQNYNIIGQIVGKSPNFTIFKYVLQRAQDPPLYTKSKVICEDKAFRLCKIPFCEIYSQLSFRDTKYEFFYPSRSQSVNNYQMVRQNNFRDLDVCLNGMNFCWHVKVLSDHYRLMYLDENTPSDSQTNKQKQTQRKIVSPDFVVGHYKRDFSNILPRSVAKSSNLIIGENSRADCLGISSVPELTEMLACQGALVEYLEHIRRRKDDKNNLRM
ncbi:uncharacterized protein DI49_3167 [Saccharomyces eubayanus]|uniref:uncharacterized protein n=1 Tax=Saccharomyces eubayanus TaxID=1080349 RepID=UPI0006BFBBFE|nr:hypothetical protein DI49_3167 [Saccharomyces eubayanus]KOG98124.1 hypothetical protein DI49_3167 [Saccharomyces eubayanus]